MKGFNFDYLLVDLSQYIDEEIKDKFFHNVALKMSMLIMKNVFNVQKMDKNIKDFLVLGNKYFQKEKGHMFLKSVIKYLFNTVETEPEKIIELKNAQ